MCQIITFPTKRIQHTNGYTNLAALFDVCDSVEGCDFYLETVEYLYNNGSITENEKYTLRRIGRQKRLKLHKNKAGAYLYTPELEQEKPDCQIKARNAHYGKHYYIDTHIDLKGRGITLLDADQGDGSKKYQVTLKAFEKLKEQYTISMECLLD